MTQRVTMAALALLLAAPALAQPAPPMAPGAMRLQPPMHGEGGGAMAMMHRRFEAGLFAGMSPAGRAILGEAMRGRPDDRLAERDAVNAARDRVITLIDAERLDVAALRRAMDDERAAAEATHARRQAAVVAALQRLSPADRRAFAANSRALKNRMDDRLARMRSVMGRRDGPGGHGPDEMPPPLW